MRLTVCLKKGIHNWLRSKGHVLIKISELEFIRNFYREVLILCKTKSFDKKIDTIVFSKDRAMQLHAFLRSFMEKVSNRSTVYILYKTSNDSHKKSYEELKGIFKKEDFVFIEETNFRDQLIEICSLSDAMTFGLFVDDMIFIQEVDYNYIIQFDTMNNIVSLGRGKDLDFSIVLGKQQKLPTLTNAEHGFFHFKWDYSKEHNDWTYPLGVSGYFYGNVELNVMLRGIMFKAPNSLENNMQYFKPFFIHRNGICKDEVVCIAVHANIAQSESHNPTIGTFSIDELLHMWNENLMIDLDKFYGKKGSQAQFQEYTFIRRSK